MSNSNYKFTRNNLENMYICICIYNKIECKGLNNVYNEKSDCHGVSA